MKSNNRITYRFDDRGPTLSNQLNKETPPNLRAMKSTNDAKVVPLYQENDSQPYSVSPPWSSKPMHHEVSTLESLMKEADKPAEIVLTQPGVPIISEWHDQQNDRVDQTDMSTSVQERVDDPRYSEHPSSVRQPNGPSWFQVFLSVTGALATGALFGYFILTLFTGATIWPKGNNEETTNITSSELAFSNGSIERDSGTLPSQTGTDDIQAGETNLSTDTNKPSHMTMVQLETAIYRYTMLQFGVFSQTDGRDIAMQQLADLGYPAASTPVGDKYYVYAGLARDDVGADQLATFMSDMDLYEKEIVVQVPQQLKHVRSGEEVSRFFIDTNALIMMGTELIHTQLKQQSMTPLGESASEKWRDHYTSWQESVTLLEQGFDDTIDKEAFSKLSTAIEQANTSMAAYDRSLTILPLWEANSYLMKAVLVQKEWFESVSTL